MVCAAFGLPEFQRGRSLSEVQERQLRCLPCKANQQRRRRNVMRLIRHNGREKNGAYNPKHNDRRFDVNNSKYIDAERVSQNIYWDCFHGYRNINDQKDPDEALEVFSEIECFYYEQRYAGFVEQGAIQQDAQQT